MIGIGVKRGRGMYSAGAIVPSSLQTVETGIGLCVGARVVHSADTLVPPSLQKS